MNSQVSNIVLKVITIFAFFVIVFMVLAKIDMYIRFQGIDQCGRISRFEQVDTRNNAKAVYPIADVYKECLSKKGL